jgi:hypothetical protein
VDLPWNGVYESLFYGTLSQLVCSSYLQATKDNLGDVLLKETCCLKTIHHIRPLQDYDAAMDISSTELNKPTCLNVHGK